MAECRGREIGGMSPPILSHAHTIKLQQHSSGCLQKSPQIKIATKSVQKLLPECIRNTLRESKFPKFSGGACLQTPLGGLWAYAHSLTIVTVHSQKSEPEPPPPPPPPPPHFCYLFSTLGDKLNFLLNLIMYEQC